MRKGIDIRRETNIAFHDFNSKTDFLVFVTVD